MDLHISTENQGHGTKMHFYLFTRRYNLAGLKLFHVSVHPLHQISQFGINSKLPRASASSTPTSSTLQVPLATKLTYQGIPTITLTEACTPITRQVSTQHGVMD